MKLFRSMGFRLGIAILTIGFVVFVPMAILILEESRQNLEHQTLAGARQTNALIIHTTLYSMLKNDRNAIEKTLAALKKVDEIDLLRIYGKKGVSFSTEQGEKGLQAEKKSGQCIVCHQSEPPLENIPDQKDYQVFTAPDGHRYLTKIDPIYNRRSCSLTDCHPTPSEQKVLGMLESRISLEHADEEMAHARNHMIAFFIVAAIIIEALIAVFIWFFLHKRVKLLKEGTVRVGEGDYGYRVDMWGSDELGELTESFNQMVDKIHEQTEKNVMLLDNIARAVKVSMETTLQLYQITSQQSAGTTQQVSTVQEVLSASEEVASTAVKISETASSVRGQAEGACETCNMGKIFADDSIRGMDQINDQVLKVRERILSLSEKAGNIGSVIDIIDEISEQTELIALNAAIEAAGAGEAGKRFDVVATEVRRLANRTMESTRVVKKLIEEIQKSITETVIVGEEEEKVVATGIKSVKELVQYFEDLLASVEKSRDATTEITLITQQQTTASEQMVVAVKEVEQAAGQIEGGVKEIESLMGELKQMSERLKSLVEDSETELH